jgi:hypothetical protein
VSRGTVGQPLRETFFTAIILNIVYISFSKMGHGLGLPHSDESFTNADLGDCMDYTSNPSVNKQPAQSNFDFLYSLYGYLPGSVEQQDGGNRNLREAIPDWVLAKWHEFDEELENHSHGSESRNGWRLLHESEGVETHEIDIGEGYSIRVRKLLDV